MSICKDQLRDKVIQTHGYLYESTFLTSLFDRVYSFKYLGVLITSDLTWSSHTKMVCDKARKLLVYCTESFMMCQLVLCVIMICRPHLDPISQCMAHLILILCGSPHLAKEKELIELECPKLALSLRIASKSWSKPYHDPLLELTPSLILLYHFTINLWNKLDSVTVKAFC